MGLPSEASPTPALALGRLGWVGTGAAGEVRGSAQSLSG